MFLLTGNAILNKGILFFFLIAVVHVGVHEANIRDGGKFVNVVFKYLSIGELIASALTT